ncbi:MAG: helix-turn-helix domain-containing protein [Treponema sp.]|nr:helix-turn-helix domain-containing protein [Treponema sp.]
MVDYHRCFIENMKFYRKKKGFSQAELAEACDVSNGTIGNIECGITKPSFDLIIQIATSLNIKPESLFLSSENNIPDNSDSNKISKNQLKRIKETFTYAINKALEDLNN